MMRWSIPLVLVLTLPVTAFAQPAAGTIELPALGLFDFTEGTVEAWVSFEFDPRGWQEDEGVYQWRGRWFTFEAPETETDLGATVVSEFGLKNHGRLGRIEPGCNWRTAFVVDGQKVPHPLLPTCTELEPGTWHHFALTWRDARVVRAYIDGELVEEREFPYTINRPVPEGARIVIGHPEGTGFNRIVIDDLRISAVAREPGEFGFDHAPPEPDPNTLLLLDFEQIADGAIRPAVMARADAPETFTIRGGRIVDGRTGQGFALTTSEAGEAQ
ncbi:MAG: LamG-like jellyroll fold domain-containing protein [Armatimonadota bacterium]